MVGEVVAFSDLSDIAPVHAAELGRMVGCKIPIHLLTDSKSLFDVVSRGSRTSEKRLMLDIVDTRKGFKDKFFRHRLCAKKIIIT